MIRKAVVAVAALSLTAACGGQEETDLTEAQGSVTSAMLHLAPAPGSAASFGSLVVGTSRVETYVVTNGGTRQSSSRLFLSITSGDFSLVAPTTGDCVSGSTTLGPGRSCTVHVQFMPTTTGARSATLTVHAQVGGFANLALSGNGLSPAVLVLSPASLVFATTAVTTPSAPQIFTIVNVGGTTTGPISSSLTGSNATDFAITSSTCSVLLAPGATCTITVVFTPAATGARSAQLTVTAIPGGVATASLAGNGV
jgi:hypothetical protein